jgi:predicted PhzF superfamily epimerase YddE/YHI9
MPASQPYYLIDAFADRPFTGNPAGVVPMATWPDDAWMQNVAMEMNQAETAFFIPNTAGGYDLRWFTPTVEVDLCGHATLASAKALAERGELAEGQTVRFSTKSGILTARRFGDQFQLNFPVTPALPAAAPPGLIESLKVTPTFIGRNVFDYLVELATESELRAMAPDMSQLATIACRGVIVTAKSSDSAFDFVSRFFAPAAGVNEDPVTGSAHCCLAEYWGKKLGKANMTGYQASRRGGIVHVQWKGERVLLRGGAVIIATGEFKV